MILKSIRLKNIRSYNDEKIDFPIGSTLLAGDVGAGKSTILMAIDFALFGIRTEMSGSDLLRHGTDMGEIELEFEADEKTIEIKRVLKRKKDSVNQSTGYLSIDAFRKEFTPNEMTSRVLELMGYPQEVLKKNRPIFRYTVYTPQEDMKSIIESNNRIETMRKIFDIDKYGLIKSNSSHLASFIRGEKRNLEGYAQDLDQLKDEMKERKVRKENLIKDLENQSMLVHDIENELLAKKNGIEKTRERLNTLSEIKNSLEKKRFELNTKRTRLERNSKEIGELREKITQNESNMQKYVSMKKPAATLTEIKKFLEDAEKERDQFLAEKTRASTHLENIRRIYSRGICEICGQPVHDKEKFATSIRKNEQLCEELEENLAKTSKKLAELKKAELDLRDYEHGMHRKADIESVIKDLESRFASVSNEIIDYEKDLEILEKEIASLEEKTKGYNDLEKTLKKQEKDHYEMQLLYVGEQRKKAGVETQISELEKNIEKLQKEIDEKEKATEKIKRLDEMIDWLANYFSGLMDTIEKQVMLSIQKEFNEYFQEWFYILMGDALTVRTDEYFTPIIEQNGYETEYRNLSGGEKTSVALAYRLSLNKVINDLVHTIKTRDLLILDEPTDGFSTDQLDRIRDVLAKLNLRQVIIVSHEPKIDTYVDNVIRVYKEDHTSRAVAQ